MYSEIYVYYVTYLHEMYTYDTYHVIYSHEHGCIMLYIHTKIYMKLYMYYAIYLHEDIHVLCAIYLHEETHV